MQTLSNRLAELADQAAGSYRRSVEEWMATAETLREARELCEHGEWIPFLDRAGIHQRTARNMVRLARFKSETVTDLGGVRETLELGRWWKTEGGDFEGLVELCRKAGHADPDDEALYCVRVMREAREIWKAVCIDRDARDGRLASRLKQLYPETPRAAGVFVGFWCDAFEGLKQAASISEALAAAWPSEWGPYPLEEETI